MFPTGYGTCYGGSFPAAKECSLHGQIYNNVNRCDVDVCDLYICREINVTDYLQSMISSNLDMNVDLSLCNQGC